MSVGRHSEHGRAVLECEGLRGLAGVTSFCLWRAGASVHEKRRVASHGGCSPHRLRERLCRRWFSGCQSPSGVMRVDTSGKNLSSFQFLRFPRPVSLLS